MRRACSCVADEVEPSFPFHLTLRRGRFNLASLTHTRSLRRGREAGGMAHACVAMIDYLPRQRRRTLGVDGQGQIKSPLCTSTNLTIANATLRSGLSPGRLTSLAAQDWRESGPGWAWVDDSPLFMAGGRTAPYHMPLVAVGMAICVILSFFSPLRVLTSFFLLLAGPHFTLNDT